MLTFHTHKIDLNEYNFLKIKINNDWAALPKHEVLRESDSKTSSDHAAFYAV